MTIVGQCNISHPVSTDSSTFSFAVAPASPLEDFDPSSPINPERSVTQNIVFSKDGGAAGSPPLAARISRTYSFPPSLCPFFVPDFPKGIYYINAYGHEIRPSPIPEFISNLGSREILVYSCGSLWTSIMPCLALTGVASAIARSKSLKAKVLLRT